MKRECLVCGENVQVTEGIERSMLADSAVWLCCLECREKMITVVREKLT